MKFTATKKSLLKAVTRVASAAEKKATTPILSNILVRAEDGRVVFSATDLVVAMSASTEAVVERPGSVALEAGALRDRVKAMPEGDVEMEVGEGSQTTIRSKASPRRFSIHGYPGEEFPKLPAKSGEAFELPPETIQKLIIATQYAISGDQTRLHLSSALFEAEGTTARMVSTDGHRLSLIELGTPELPKFSMLVPGPGVSELKTLVEELVERKEQTMKLVRSGAFLFAWVEDIELSIKLVDAAFPPYQQVIPKESPVKTVVSRTSLLESVKAVMLASNERTQGVRVQIGGGNVSVTSESPEAGSAADEVSCESTGSSLSGLNGHYLCDVLRAILTASVEIHSGGELDPVKILHHPANENEAFTAVVMPMRLG